MVDCHMHMVLDAADWRSAIGRHAVQVDKEYVRSVVKMYAEKGYTYLRDGGDRWGVGATARELAPAYGITLRTPLAPLCREGHYGGFIGEKYHDLRQYAQMVQAHREAGADFIKLMISGIMDFDRFGVLSEDGLPASEIRELIHIAREEGFAVMAHGNGARCVEAAALAGVDSIEHGAYQDGDSLQAMQEAGTVWVPTLSPIANLRGTGRFSEDVIRKILDSSTENLRLFSRIGGFLAPGSDAGAWAVPHGAETEEKLLTQALGTDAAEILSRGTAQIQKRF